MTLIFLFINFSFGAIVSSVDHKELQITQELIQIYFRKKYDINSIDNIIHKINVPNYVYSSQINVLNHAKDIIKEPNINYKIERCSKKVDLNIPVELNTIISNYIFDYCYNTISSYNLEYINLYTINRILDFFDIYSNQNIQNFEIKLKRIKDNFLDHPQVLSKFNSTKLSSFLTQLDHNFFTNKKTELSFYEQEQFKNTYFYKDIISKIKEISDNSNKNKFTNDIKRKFDQIIGDLHRFKNNIQKANKENIVRLISISLIKNKEYQFLRKFLWKIISISDKDLFDVSVYFTVLSFIIEEKYQDVIELFHDNSSKFKNIILSNQTKFWIAHSFYKKNFKAQSTDLFSSIIEHDPLSYYSIISSKYIEQNSVNPIVKLFGQNSLSKKYSELSLSNDGKIEIYKLTLLNSIYPQEILNNFVNSFKFRPIKNLFNEKNQLENDQILRSYIYQLISEILNHHKKYLVTFGLINEALYSKAIIPSNELLELLFPRPFEKQIQIQSKFFDANILTSLIRQESAFNPLAVSTVGATGLMQIMPSTGKIFQKDLNNHQLKEPAINIEIGSKYLKILSKKYNGNIVYALAAYNAGESNVRTWQKEERLHKHPLKAIELIPFPETNQYVKLILRNMFFYNYLNLNHKEFQLPLDF